MFFVNIVNIANMFWVLQLLQLLLLTWQHIMKEKKNQSCLFREVLTFLYCSDTQSQSLPSEIYFNLRPLQLEWKFSIYWHDAFSVFNTTPSVFLLSPLPPPDHINSPILMRTHEESYDPAGNGFKFCFL